MGTIGKYNCRRNERATNCQLITTTNNLQSPPPQQQTNANTPTERLRTLTSLCIWPLSEGVGRFPGLLQHVRSYWKKDFAQTFVSKSYFLDMKNYVNLEFVHCFTLEPSKQRCVNSTMSFTHVCSQVDTSIRCCIGS